MSYLPTTNDLANQGVALVNDGFEPHEDDVARIGDLARTAGEPSSLVDVLVDRDATDAVRSRAFAVIARHWATYRASLADAQFRRLLAAWTAHQDLKKSAAPVELLWESRATLDQERRAMACQNACA